MTFRLILKTALPVLSIGLLSGCQHLFERPGPMPTGYAYHQNLYKSPPADPAANIGYEYSAKANEESIALWRPKVKELLLSLEEKIPLAGKKVYVRAPYLHSAQNTTFDFVLRDELRAQGVEIVSSHYAGLILAYNLSEVDVSEPDKLPYEYHENLSHDAPEYRPEADFQPMVLELSLFEGVTPLAKTGGIYVVPMYGHKLDLPSDKLFRAVNGQKSLHDLTPEKEDLRQ